MVRILTKNQSINLTFIEGTQTGLPLQSAFGAGNELGFEMFASDCPAFVNDPGGIGANITIEIYAISNRGYLQYTDNLVGGVNIGGFGTYSDKLSTVYSNVTDQVSTPGQVDVELFAQTGVSINAGVVAGNLVSIASGTLILGYVHAYNYGTDTYRLHGYSHDFGAVFFQGSIADEFKGYLGVANAGVVDFVQTYEFDNSVNEYIYTNTWTFDGLVFNVVLYDDLASEIHLVTFAPTPIGDPYLNSFEQLETDDAAINALLYNGFFFTDNANRTWCFIAYDGADRISPILFRISNDYNYYDLYSLNFDAATTMRINTYLAGAGKFTPDGVPALAINYSPSENMLMLTTGNEPMFYAIANVGGVTGGVGVAPGTPVHRLGCTNYCLPLIGA